MELRKPWEGGATEHPEGKDLLPTQNRFTQAGGVAPGRKEGHQRCVNYVGLACVDGTCPAAWDETRHLKENDCENCFFYKGCEDCALAGTEYCAGEKAENNTIHGGGELSHGTELSGIP